jgi:hypothetical protein
MTSIARQHTAPLEYIHDKIHKGDLFSISVFADAVADNADTEVTLVVASGYTVHARASFCVGAGGEVTINEGSTAASGSAYTPVNRNRKSTKTSAAATVRTGDTVSVAGTALENYAVSYSNAFSESYRELVLDPGTYTFILTNRSGSAQIQSISIDFYEIAK